MENKQRVTYLILDTNIWVYLANGLDPISGKQHKENLHFELRQALKVLKDKGDLTILICDIILQEFQRNKAACFARVKSLEQKKANLDHTLLEVEKYAAESDFKELKERMLAGLQADIEANLQHISDVETFLQEECTAVPVTDEIKLTVYNLAIYNKPPFHNGKNNVADATILLSAAAYLKGKLPLTNDFAIFVSNNVSEFTDGKVMDQFHPDLTSLLLPIDISYTRVLPAALQLREEILLDLANFYEMLSNQALKQFTWDIEDHGENTLMALDVPYRGKATGNQEYLTLTLGKKKGVERPLGLSVILPGNVLADRLIGLRFVTRTRKENAIEHAWDESLIYIPIAETTENTTIARMKDVFAEDASTGERIDVLLKLLSYGSLFITYTDKQEASQAVSVTLAPFQEQYPGLE